MFSDVIPVPHFYPSIALYQWSRFYDIQFTKTVSHLLEKPYQTNCLKYDKGFGFAFAFAFHLLFNN
jgi:hypothetical protein